MNAKEIGVKLARDLMALGDEHTKAQRIEFKGGNWPDGEIAQGGMNENALAIFFSERLAEYLTPNATAKAALAERPRLSAELGGKPEDK